MLEARQHELEAHRQRTSRTFSMILVGVVFLTSGAIWIFPSAPVVSEHAATRPATAATADSTEDVRFAMQLLNFGNPSATPATSVKAQATAESVVEAVTKVSAAMP